MKSLANPATPRDRHAEKADAHGEGRGAAHRDYHSAADSIIRHAAPRGHRILCSLVRWCRLAARREREHVAALDAQQREGAAT